jgi:hypothetical protein
VKFQKLLPASIEMRECRSVVFMCGRLLTLLGNWIKNTRFVVYLIVSPAILADAPAPYVRIEPPFRQHEQRGRAFLLLGTFLHLYPTI